MNKKIWFQRLILINIILSLLAFTLEFLPFLPNYEHLEIQLSEGLIEQILPDYLIIIILLFILILYYLSLIFLYFFISVGRILYTISLIISLILTIFIGDTIDYSILFPVNYLGSVVEGLILYMIFFTKLKHQFSASKKD